MTQTRPILALRYFSDSLCFTFVYDNDDNGKVAAMEKIRRHFWPWGIESETHHVIDLVLFLEFS